MWMIELCSFDVQKCMLLVELGSFYVQKCMLLIELRSLYIWKCMLFGEIKENNAKKKGKPYRTKGLDINGDKAYATIPKSEGSK